MMSKDAIFTILDKVLEKYGKKDWKHIILGIIKTESSFNPYACRFEPKWSYLKTPSKYAKELRITVDTEIVFQKTSWGLMQVMGSVYRELGYDGHLNALSCDIEKQLIYGIRHFSRMFNFYKDLNKAILGYNRGFGVNDSEVKLSLMDESSYLSKVLKYSKEFLEV